MNLLAPPSTLTPGAIVDCYLRDSGGEGQDRSVPSQLLEMQAYCRTHGLILRNIYKDTRSGRSIVGREDFERMIDDIQLAQDLPHGLLLWDYARFARNAKDAIFNIALIEQQGVIVHSLTDEVPDGEFRDLIRYIKHLGNEAERKKNAAAVKREMHQLVRHTKAMFGVPPRGFKREPLPPIPNQRTGQMRKLHKWVPDPEWTRRIKTAFQMKAAHASLAQIHKATGLFGSLNSYRTFFQNKLYIGILEFGGQTYEDYCPPIVDRPTWDAVQKILALHADRQHVTSPNGLHPRRRSATATYLLSGLAHCARCGSPLWGMSSKQRNGTYYLRYACTRAKRTRDCDLKPIPAQALEEEIINRLTVVFSDEGYLSAIIEKDRQRRQHLATKSGQHIKELNKQLRNVQRSLANIAEALSQLNGRKSKTLLEKLTELESQETQLRSELQALKTRTPIHNPPLQPHQVTALAQDIITRLQSKDKTTVRATLQALIETITVNRTPQHTYGTIQIHTPNQPEPPSGNTASTTKSPVGAPIHRHSIEFSFVISPPHIIKRHRS